MRTSSTRPLALAAATALLLAACAGDDGAASTTTSPDGSDLEEPGEGLRAPVPVRVSGDGSSGARMAADASVAEGEMGILPWFGGWEYEVGPDMPALPTQAIGYEFPAGAQLDQDVVRRIAAALGVEGDPRQGSAGEGVRWHVGPDDGSAPSLVVLDDGPLSWYRSDAWALRRWDCVAPEPRPIDDGDPDEPVVDEPVADEPVVDEPVADESVVDEPVADEPIDAPALDEIVIETCPEPEPPTGVLSAGEAEAEARRILGELGLDPAAFELESWADDWFASVTAWPLLDGLRWPLAYGFGFGADGVLEWANGHAATALPAGPYPLVDLEQALGRLEQPVWWGAAGARAYAEPAIEVDGAAGAAVSDQPIDDDGALVEPVKQTAVLVDVRPELWWAGAPDGSVWLLPAYNFIDTEGRWHTVPAVADEFLVVEEPIVLMDPPVAIDEPVADPAEDAVDVKDVGEIVGLSVEAAEGVLAERGLSMRIVRLDGEDLPATMDLVPTRINVAVVDDVVTEVLSTG